MKMLNTLSGYFKAGSSGNTAVAAENIGVTRLLFLIFMSSLILFQGVILKQDFYLASILLSLIALTSNREAFVLSRKVAWILPLLILPGIISLPVSVNRGEAPFGLVKLLFVSLLILLLQTILRKAQQPHQRFTDLILLTVFAAGFLAAAYNFIAYFFQGLNVDGTVRFNAVIPYANMLAAFLFVSSLIGVWLFIRPDTMNWHKVVIFTGIAVINGALLMTQSRSMLVISCFFHLLYLLFVVRGRRRLRLLIILAFAVCGILAIVFTFPQFSRLAGASLQSTEWLERLAYYQDGIKMLKDYLPWGTGPDGWASLFYQYQTAMYSTHYVHSSPLQMLLDYGIPGLAVIIAFTVLTLRMLVKAVRTYRNDVIQLRRLLLLAFLLVGLSVHALIDIDSEFMLFSILSVLFASMIWVYGEGRGECIVTLKKPVSLAARALIVLFIAAQTVFLASCLYLDKGKDLMKKGDAGGAIKEFVQASGLNPWWAEPYNNLGDCYKSLYVQYHQDADAVKGIESYSSAQNLDPFNPAYVAGKSYIYRSGFNPEEGIEEYRKLIDLQPLIIEYYEALAKSLNESAAQKSEAGDEAGAREASLEVMELKQAVKYNALKLSPLAAKLKNKTNLTVTPALEHEIAIACEFLDRSGK